METAGPFSAVSVPEQLSEDSSIEVWETGGMGDWNRPRHLVLAVSSKIKVMCHSCIFIVFLIQCIPSHLQQNIIECMRGVYVLAKHSSCINIYISGLFFWNQSFISQNTHFQRSILTQIGFSSNLMASGTA